MKCAPDIGPNARISATKCGTGGNRIGKQRNRNVAARQSLPHNARADNRSEQKCGAQQLRYSTPGHSRPHVGFVGPDEGAEELLVHLGSNGIHINAGVSEELAGILDVVYARWLDGGVFESCIS